MRFLASVERSSSTIDVIDAPVADRDAPITPNDQKQNQNNYLPFAPDFGLCATAGQV
jgi:hypothetical protein